MISAAAVTLRSATVKVWIAALALGLIGLAIAYFASDASARMRPTFSESHAAVHMVLDDYADLVDGHLVVGPCRREGYFSTVCRARIDGPDAYRYRVVVTGMPSRNFLVGARAR